MKVNLIGYTKIPGYDGDFNLTKALEFCSKMGGVCYAEEGFKKLMKESEEATYKRLNRVLNSGHHSVFDHFKLTFEITDIPKIIAMILNNEKDYCTSEKSARYTHFENLPGDEGELYEKWYEKLIPIIKEAYPCLVNDKAKDPMLKIKKLAQENARYFVSVFQPTTTMAYSTSLRQLNYLIYMFYGYIDEAESKPLNDFDALLIPAMKEFVLLFDKFIVAGLTPEGKNRRLSLFGDPAYSKAPVADVFSYVYQTEFHASFACVAQNHRHRSEHSFIYIPDKFKFYVPEIIEDNEGLKKEWLEDSKKVSKFFPQGMIVRVVQTGNIDTLILKCRERACSCAQLETMRHSVETLQKLTQKSEYAESILSQTNGATARCKFLNYKCKTPCVFGAKQVKRKV